MSASEEHLHERQALKQAWPGFIVFDDPSLEELDSLEQTPDSLLMVPEILTSHPWELSLISNLPKDPGYPDEEHDDQLAQDNPPEQRADSSQHQQQSRQQDNESEQQVDTSERESGNPERQHGNLDQQIDTTEQQDHKPESQSLAAPRCTSTDISSQASTCLLSSECTPGSPSACDSAAVIHMTNSCSAARKGLDQHPRFVHKRRKRVCIGCLSTRSLCSGKAPCERCVEVGEACRYQRCWFGPKCTIRGCTRDHDANFDREDSGYRPAKRARLT